MTLHFVPEIAKKVLVFLFGGDWKVSEHEEGERVLRYETVPPDHPRHPSKKYVSLDEWADAISSSSGVTLSSEQMVLLLEAIGSLSLLINEGFQRVDWIDEPQKIAEVLAFAPELFRNLESRGKDLFLHGVCLVQNGQPIFGEACMAFSNRSASAGEWRFGECTKYRDARSLASRLNEGLPRLLRLHSQIRCGEMAVVE